MLQSENLKAAPSCGLCSAISRRKNNFFGSSIIFISDVRIWNDSSISSMATDSNSRSSCECFVCLEDFSDGRLPKILFCGHTICAGCVKGFVEQITNEEIECPACRKTTILPLAGLPTNYALKTLLEERNRERRLSCIHCAAGYQLDQMRACQLCDFTLICSKCSIKYHPGHTVQGMHEFSARRHKEALKCFEAENVVDSLNRLDWSLYGARLMIQDGHGSFRSGRWDDLQELLKQTLGKIEHEKESLIQRRHAWEDADVVLESILSGHFEKQLTEVTENGEKLKTVLLRLTGFVRLVHDAVSDAENMVERLVTVLRETMDHSHDGDDDNWPLMAWMTWISLDEDILSKIEQRGMEVEPLDESEDGQELEDAAMDVPAISLDFDDEDLALDRLFDFLAIDKANLNQKSYYIENEADVLLRCVHANIIKLREAYQTPDQYFLIMEFLENGDLFDAIKREGNFDEPSTAGFVADVASALRYLHSHNVVHRDVKPENLLLTGDFRIKLGDFGLACHVQGPLFRVCGTPTYVAPEVLAERGYGLEIDCWSLGIITYILLCGFAPFRHQDRNELFRLIRVGRFQFEGPKWMRVSKGAKLFVSSLLNADPLKRCTARLVFRNSWLRQMMMMSREN